MGAPPGEPSVDLRPRPGAEHLAERMMTNGRHLLDDVEQFLARFVAYPSEPARIAHTLWIGHTWFMDFWESTPRIAFLSPEPGSGKSRALEVTEPLVPRPVHAVNTTPAYLFRKVSDPDGAPTILYDEIDTVFGPKAKDNEDVRGMLNAGHRRGAMAGRCVVRGKNVVTEELPAYCAVALAGLNDVPDTIMSRSVVIRMRRRAPDEPVEPWRNRINAPEAERLAGRLRVWAENEGQMLDWPEMPSGIEDRAADVWEALLAIADLAAGEWPARARVAAVALVADFRAGIPSLGVQLLRDLRSVFAGHDKLATETILEALHAMPEAVWGDLRGKPVDSRWLSRQLTKYGVSSKTVRIGDHTPRGYVTADLADPWARYVADPEAPFGKLGHTLEEPKQPALSLSPQGSATSATSATCDGCGFPMPAALIAAGETTHANCNGPAELSA